MGSETEIELIAAEETVLNDTQQFNKLFNSITQQSSSSTSLDHGDRKDSAAKPSIILASKKLKLQQSRQDKPGPVRPTATLQLHTNIVHTLFYGRDRSGDVPEILGFLYFTHAVRVIEIASQQDDPYADYKLLELEAEIRGIKDRIDEIQGDYDKRIKAIQGLHIDMLSIASTNPKVAHLDFKSRIGSLAMLALASFDMLMLKGLTLRHFSLIDKDVMNKHKDSLKTDFNRLFRSPRSFRVSGASRDDFASNNARAIAAIEKFGELPTEILRGDIKPGY